MIKSSFAQTLAPIAAIQMLYIKDDPILNKQIINDLKLD